MSTQEFYQFLLGRQSSSALMEPGPDHATIERMLQVAGTVPDHGGLKPYRFIIVQGEGREAFAAAMIDAASEVKGSIDDKMRAKISAKAYAAPIQVIIVFSPVDHGKIPEWEQMCTASCTGYALALAANTQGFGAVWKSFAFAPGSSMRQLFKLNGGERVLGWINVGTAKPHDHSPRLPLDVAKHALFVK